MRKIESLQILRAFAALAVVLEHAWDHIVPLAHGTTLGWPTRLSGIWCVWRRSVFLSERLSQATMLPAGPASRAAATSFFFARVRRTYPIYSVWLAVLVASTAFVFRGHAGGGGFALPALNAATLIHNALLLPTLSVTGWGMMLPQAWTLTYEMYFSTLFALCIG